MAIRSFKIPTVLTVTLFLLGGALLLIPPAAIPYIGSLMLGLGALVGVWTICGWLNFRRLGKLISKRIHVNFVKANFDSIGMTSPYVDFYFNIHSCLSHHLMVTGRKKGELCNPYVEAWRSNWEIDTNYQGTIMPDTNTEIRVRWIVPQGHNSPMAEFAFRAKDGPPEQRLTFEDMHVEVKARFWRLESNVGWLQLPRGVIPVIVPDHPIFSTVRQEYLRQRDSQ